MLERHRRVTKVVVLLLLLLLLLLLCLERGCCLGEYVGHLTVEGRVLKNGRRVPLS
jgi:hypothetical protein